jgi:phosphohistidine phosphatase SixA
MLLIRHASAGKRLSTPSLDNARELDRTGRREASLVRESLAGYSIDLIVSSPLVRCLQTVAPLGTALGLGVEVRSELEPRATRRDALRLLRELPPTALVCTHREVFESVFDGAIECEKSGAWVIERRGRSLTPVAYLPPPVAQPRRRRAALVSR